MCADCGISGRNTGTSCAAFTLLDRDDLRDELIGAATSRATGRSMFGICRAFASGTILMMPPDSTATNWCT